MATINAIGGDTYLLVWRMHGKLEVEHVIDSIPGAREVWICSVCLCVVYLSCIICRSNGSLLEMTPSHPTFLLSSTVELLPISLMQRSFCGRWPIRQSCSCLPMPKRSLSMITRQVNEWTFLFSSLIMGMYTVSVYRVDCTQGLIERQHDFREPQDVVAVVGKEENFSFVGLSEKVRGGPTEAPTGATPVL